MLWLKLLSLIMTLRLEAEQKQEQRNWLQNNLQTMAYATGATIVSASQCWKKQSERWKTKSVKEVLCIMEYPKEDKVLGLLKLST